MIKSFLPREYKKSVFQINPKELSKKGIKGIITDLDNTLVEWDRPNPTPKIREWFEELKRYNIKITIVSNNNKERVQKFSEPLGVPFIHKAKKPLTIAFYRALELMDLHKDEVIIIGDQLLTDIFGGNRAGFYTVLVVPVASSDGFFTRLNRKIERKIMNSLERKGLLKREESN